MDGAVASLAPAELVARAKVNLALHVTGRRPDGYHVLDSLVVFARDGDRLAVSPASTDRFELVGPFAHTIPAGDDNIVLRALAAARRALKASGIDLPPQRLALTKNLPPSSGIGGGSADAAALLRLIADRHPAQATALREVGLRLGADVPMCMDGTSARVRGIGEIGSPITIGCDVSLLLVNPRVEVSTPAVFLALRKRDNDPLPDLPADGFPSIAHLIRYLDRCRNDLAAPAIERAPAIGAAIAAIVEAGARLTRMSGSGATVFGLFDDDDACRKAARQIADAHPGWWVCASAVSKDDDDR